MHSTSSPARRQIEPRRASNSSETWTGAGGSVGLVRKRRQRGLGLGQVPSQRIVAAVGVPVGGGVWRPRVEQVVEIALGVARHRHVSPDAGIGRELVLRQQLPTVLGDQRNRPNHEVDLGVGEHVRETDPGPAVADAVVAAVRQRRSDTD